MNSSEDTTTGSGTTRGGETVVGDVGSMVSKLGASVPFLTIIYPAADQRHFEVRETAQIIGRGRHVAVVLDDRMSSREHCRFWRDEQGVVIEDLGSTNGTLIDNHPITNTRLTHESRLQVGNHIFRLEYRNRHELEYEQKLIKAATTDPLTGIPNRQTLMERAHAAFAHCRDEGLDLAVCMMDIDHFKRINDTWGHPAGDLVIKRVAQLLAEQCRAGDVYGRYGGEEFMLLLPETGIDEAEGICERVRGSIEAYEFGWNNEAMPVTVSLGVCGVVSSGQGTLAESIEAADTALYQAKKDGRNRTCRD